MSARCPEHGIPDCSPLLNGCSRLTAPEHIDVAGLRATAQAADDMRLGLVTSHPRVTVDDWLAESKFRDTFYPATVLALFDLIERAEKERDRLAQQIKDERKAFQQATVLYAQTQNALRAAVVGKADEWEERAMTCCSLVCENCGARYIDPDELRGLITEERSDV